MHVYQWTESWMYMPTPHPKILTFIVSKDNTCQTLGKMWGGGGVELLVLQFSVHIYMLVHSATTLSTGHSSRLTFCDKSHYYVIHKLENSPKFERQTLCDCSQTWQQWMLSANWQSSHGNSYLKRQFVSLSTDLATTGIIFWAQWQQNETFSRCE